MIILLEDIKESEADFLHGKMYRRIPTDFWEDIVRVLSNFLKSTKRVKK